MSEMVVLGSMTPLLGALYSDSAGNISTDPPCETVLMATNEQFREFAAKVAEVEPSYGNAFSGKCCLFCGSKRVNVHKLDCVWIEARRIIAAIDKYNEKT